MLTSEELVDSIKSRIGKLKVIKLPEILQKERFSVPFHWAYSLLQPTQNCSYLSNRLIFAMQVGAYHIMMQFGMNSRFAVVGVHAISVY